MNWKGTFTSSNSKRELKMKFNKNRLFHHFFLSFSLSFCVSLWSGNDVYIIRKGLYLQISLIHLCVQMENISRSLGQNLTARLGWWIANCSCVLLRLLSGISVFHHKTRNLNRNLSSWWNLCHSSNLSRGINKLSAHFNPRNRNDHLLQAAMIFDSRFKLLKTMRAQQLIWFFLSSFLFLIIKGLSKSVWTRREDRYSNIRVINISLSQLPGIGEAHCKVGTRVRDV